MLYESHLKTQLTLVLNLLGSLAHTFLVNADIVGIFL